MTVVYVLLCVDGSLYCGKTNNLDRRMEEHLSGKGRGAKYTRSHKPKALIAVWTYPTIGMALRAEKAFKSLTRREKINLIYGDAAVWVGGSRERIVRDFSD